MHAYAVSFPPVPFFSNLFHLLTAFEVFTKYLDQSNISNAYTSGMKEDLGLYGNELNYFNVMYFTAYVIAQIPMLLLISRPTLYAS